MSKASPPGPARGHRARACREMITVSLTRRTFLKTLVALPAGAVLLAACGSNSGGGMPGMNHGGGTTTAEYDQNFIDMMVTHHQAAIDMAKVAQRQGEHAEIKQLAD